MPRAQIATKQAKFTLEQLHAELGGKILDNKAEGAKLAEAMKHVEAVLKLMDPAYDVRPIAIRRRKPNPYFKRGTVFREALNALRLAAKPLTAHELTLAMLAAKDDLKNAPEKAVRALEGAVRVSLKNHEGQAVERVGNGMPGHWKLILST